MENMKLISENPPILNLPSVILSVIFSLLPIKSIWSCKSVCKLWCSIIQNPLFSLSSQSIVLFVRSTDIYEPYGSLHFIEPVVDYSVKKINGDLCASLDEKSMIKFNVGGFDGSLVKMLSIVNSCKGLVCLTVSSEGFPLGTIKNEPYDRNWAPFFVCNPITSDYVVIEQPISTERGYSRGAIHAGFGFSTKSDHYKLIRLFSDYHLRKSGWEEGPVVAAVYTLDSDEKWRILDNRPPQDYSESWCGEATFFLGSLHWIIVDWGKYVGSIAAFDCQEENFFLVEFPSGLRYDDAVGCRPVMDLATFQSRLCLCIWIFRGRNDIDIWVMDEYGVRESWRKLFVFSLDGYPFKVRKPLKPLAYLNSGEILMLSVSRKLVSYDVRTNTLTAIKIPGVTAKVEPMLFDPIFLPTKNLLMYGGEQPKTITTE